MKTNALLYTARCITHVSIGSGEGDGPIDRPLLREASSMLPCISAEALKAALKRRTRPLPGGDDSTSADRWMNLFGRDVTDARAGQDDGGLLKPQQASLLALPVPSPEMMRVWVTCRHTLWHLKDLCRRIGLDCPNVPDDDTLDDESTHVLVGSRRKAGPLRVGPYDVEARRSDLVGQWQSWIRDRFFDPDDGFGCELVDRLAIVPAWLFFDRMMYGLEVKTRTRMKPGQRIVETMWSTESLPEGALLAGVVSIEPRSRLPAPAAPVEVADAADWLSGKASPGWIGATSPSPITLDVGGLQGIGHSWIEARFHQGVALKGVGN